MDEKEDGEWIPVSLQVAESDRRYGSSADIEVCPEGGEITVSVIVDFRECSVYTRFFFATSITSESFRGLIR